MDKMVVHQDLLRKTIWDICLNPFDEPLLMDTAKNLCSLMGADYFALNVVGAGRGKGPLFISNNDPSFVPIYLSVQEKDFLLHHTLECGEEYVLSRDPLAFSPEHRDFVEPVQEARPISDIIYVPLRSDGFLNGYWAIGRAGLKSPVYTSDELNIFRLVTGFLSDAFARSLRLPLPAEEEAILDGDGEIVGMGDGIRDFLFRLERLYGGSGPSCILKRHFERFLQNPKIRYSAKIVLPENERAHILEFSLYRQNYPLLRHRGVAFAVVSHFGKAHNHTSQAVHDSEAIMRRFDLTDRERDVVQELLRGLPNKVIASRLGIDESTVKRHIYNIFGKTGFRSRVELVLGIRGR